jgi:hypothetical protein
MSIPSVIVKMQNIHAALIRRARRVLYVLAYRPGRPGRIKRQVIFDSVSRITLQFTPSRGGELNLRLWADHIPSGVRDFTFDKRGVLEQTSTPVARPPIEQIQQATECSV